MTFATARGDGFEVRTFGGGQGSLWTIRLPGLDDVGAAETAIRLAGAGPRRVLTHIRHDDPLNAFRQDSLVLAPSRGRGAVLGGCRSAFAVVPDAFAADAARAVYALRACADGSQRVVLRRHADGAETDLPVDPTHQVAHLRVAGRFVAFTDYAPAQNATTLRVFDGDSLTEAGTIAEPGTDLGAFALQDDGTVALCLDGQIVEYALAGGTRTLPESQCDGPLVAGDTGYLSVVPSGRGGESLLLAYSGGKPRTVAYLFGEAGEQGVPAMHARLAALRRRFCGGWEVVTTTVGALPVRAEKRCTGAIDGAPQRVRKGTVLRVPLRCPQGCVGTVTVTAPGHSGTRRTATVRLSRRGSRAVRLPLAPAARHARVKVRLSVLQPPFASSRTVDRTVVRSPS